MPIGRIRKVHEFPKRDFPNVEDVRGNTKLYAFNAYVVDGDYFTQRDALVDAYNAKEYGLLVHPYLGNLRVYSMQGSYTETKTEGRVARFSLNFVLFEEEELTTSFVDVISKTRSDMNSMFAEAQALFTEIYNISQYPADVIDLVIDGVDGALDLMSTARATVGSVDDFKQKITVLKAKLTVDFMLQAEDLFNELKDIATFGTGADADEDVSETSTSSFRLMIEEQNRVIESLSAPLDTSDMTSVINNAIVQQTLASLLNVSINAEYTSIDDLEETNAPIFSALTFQEDTENYASSLQFALRQSRYTLHAYVESLTGELGNIWNYTVQDTSKPPMIISSELYGDTTKENDIIKNNEIGNPFFADHVLKVVDYE